MQNSMSLFRNPTNVCAFVKTASYTVIPASSEILFEAYISGEISPAKHVIVEPMQTIMVFLFL
jgi:K+-transporting ATPase A subunit